MSIIDSFAASFDSIQVAPGRAIMLAAEAEPTDTPGFSLLDDSGGRFSIDRDTGVISVLDRELLATERHARHDVRVRVVEAAGASYELRLTLRMTGPVPQVLGFEENDALAAMARDLVEPAGEMSLAPPQPQHWPRLVADAAEAAPFGALRPAAPTSPLDSGEAAFVASAAALTPAAPNATWVI